MISGAGVLFSSEWECYWGLYGQGKPGGGSFSLRSGKVKKTCNDQGGNSIFIL